MANHTVYHLKFFIIFQNFFCINRWFLLESLRNKIISWSICIVSFTWITSVVFYDIVVTNSYVKWYIYIAEAVAGFLILNLAFSTRKTKDFFEVVKELDEKYGLLKEQEISIKKFVVLTMMLTFLSIVIDAIDLKVLRMPNSVVLLVTVAFCVQDTELAFYAMIANSFNTRLNKLIDMDPVEGSQVYRRLLAATFSFSKPFYKQIVLMVFIIQLTSIIYAGTAFLASGALVGPLRVYFLWRELKTLYSVWLICYAADRTQQICERLLFRLAEKFVFEHMDKDNKRVTTRWYHCMQCIQPSVTEAVSIVKPNLPLKILDWTFNYLIMIVQVYMTYYN